MEGWHAGYMRLPDPVKHRRLVELHKGARRLAIEDTLEMEEAHDVELFFHFHEDCRVEPAGEDLVVTREGSSPLTERWVATRTVCLWLPCH